MRRHEGKLTLKWQRENLEMSLKAISDIRRGQADALAMLFVASGQINYMFCASAWPDLNRQDDQIAILQVYLPKLTRA